MAKKRQAAAPAENPSAIRVGLLGLGTVGGGVAEILATHGELITARTGMTIELTRARVRSSRKKRPGAAASIPTTTKPGDIVGAPDIDLVVELLGGLEPARTMVMDAIAADQSVVTANKAILAKHGNAIFRACDRSPADIHFEAAVAGGVPIIRTLREGLASDRINSINGILNGTTNFILSRMRRGAEYEEALAEAQRLGYAEADPTLDVNGRDAADKLAILIRLAFGTSVRVERIATRGITELTPKILADAKVLGCRVKLVASAWRASAINKKSSQDHIFACVQPTLVPIGHELSAVPGAQNAIRISSDSLGTTLYQGPGAGGMPTGSAVVADIIEAARSHRSGIRRNLGLPQMAAAPKLASYQDATSAFYVRLEVADQPGVLAEIAESFANFSVSLATVAQSRCELGATIVITTHPTSTTHVESALKAIRKRHRRVKRPCLLPILDAAE